MRRGGFNTNDTGTGNILTVIGVAGLLYLAADDALTLITGLFDIVGPLLTNPLAMTHVQAADLITATFMFVFAFLLMAMLLQPLVWVFEWFIEVDI